VKILNSEDPEQSCPIAFISIDSEYQGLRITPNVYTTLEEIDEFIAVMARIIKHGSIPA